MGQRIAASSPRHQPSGASCQFCSLSSLCLPLAVDNEHMKDLDALVDSGRTLGRGALVFRQNDPFHSVYVIRTGAVKTFVLDPTGGEQITGFFLPGEVVGLDSAGAGELYASSAKALEHTSVCEVPFHQMEELAARLPSLQHHFFHLMGDEIRGSQQLSMLLSRSSAEERMASLLLSLSSRFRRRRLSPERFRLPMARNEIANYLGLAVETVSRSLTRFQQQGLIRLDGRELELLDIDGLQDVLSQPMLCTGKVS